MLGEFRQRSSTRAKHSSQVLKPPEEMKVRKIGMEPRYSGFISTTVNQIFWSQRTMHYIWTSVDNQTFWSQRKMYSIATRVDNQRFRSHRKMYSILTKILTTKQIILVPTKMFSILTEVDNQTFWSQRKKFFYLDQSRQPNIVVPNKDVFYFDRSRQQNILVPDVFWSQTK